MENVASEEARVRGVALAVALAVGLYPTAVVTLGLLASWMRNVLPASLETNWKVHARQSGHKKAVLSQPSCNCRVAFPSNTTVRMESQLVRNSLELDPRLSVDWHGRPRLWTAVTPSLEVWSHSSAVAVCVAVGVGVALVVGLGVAVAEGVPDSVACGVGDPVADGVAVAVRVRVADGVRVSLGVAVLVAVSVAVDVAVLVGVEVGEHVVVGVGVEVSGMVLVGVGVGVLVALSVSTGVAVLVRVRVGVSVGVQMWLSVGVSVRVAVQVWVGVVDCVGVGVGCDEGVEVSVNVCERVTLNVVVGVAVRLTVRLTVRVGVGVGVGVAAMQVPTSSHAQHHRDTMSGPDHRRSLASIHPRLGMDSREWPTVNRGSDGGRGAGWVLCIPHPLSGLRPGSQNPYRGMQLGPQENCMQNTGTSSKVGASTTETIWHRGTGANTTKYCKLLIY